MAYKTFAAIYVGSSRIAMKIFEVNAKKTFRQIDSVNNWIEIGKDTYSKGSVGTKLINQVCDILNGFKLKMKEYKVSDYRAYATSAIREAVNSELVLDTVKRRTNITVNVLSNSEQRYFIFKGLVAKYKDFHQVVSKNTAFVDVGAGSVQLSLFDKNNLVVTENIPIGTIRVRDYLSILGNRNGRLDTIIEEYVENDIATFRNMYLNDKEIKNIIAVGDVVNSIKKIIYYEYEDEKITRKQFDVVYNTVVRMSPQEIAEKYGILYEKATLLLPSVIIYQSFLNNCKAEEIYTPEVDFCEGIVASYMDEGSGSVFDHNFDDDILASAFNISKRYRCNRPHIEKTAENALCIFDSIAKSFGLTKKERLQLHIAAILHECGNFINLHDGAMNSYHIVANTEIIGLSHQERMEIANVILYNPLALPEKNNFADREECDYVKVAKLAAILKIANILDKSHTQKIENLEVGIKNEQLVLTVKTYEDITLEAGLFEKRADFFEGVYGIRPVLRQKRSV